VVGGSAAVATTKKGLSEQPPFSTLARIANYLSRNAAVPEATEKPRKSRSEFKRGPERAKVKAVVSRTKRIDVPFGGFSMADTERHRRIAGPLLDMEHGNDLHFALTRSIVVAARRWRKIASERIRAYDQSMARLEILYLVSYTGEALSQRQLAQLISVNESAIIHLLNALAKEGLIERRQSETDRRVTYNCITESGLTRLRELMAEVSAIRQEICGEFADEQIRDVLSFMDAFLQKMEGYL
jgi:MarR family transcriptional regulator for hemolysin